ncbi:uncharacterized protein EV154DRAFT_487840 [Mucor mucedo]|uniref:uncharacterized protein n=1 Tax=Mucor mucedo TaxID=29922 RepID=UPI00221E9D70|nr:uncharacterized protein EV154DRAFT_487840 [Mucor mucedo]KAI7870282.1 hypothetical protein EV154DRAFT_487840 [Mucor mucedo]
MGNKIGSNRFSAIEQDVLLEAVQDKLPTGADEWELVQVFFKKRMVEDASQNGTGNNQVAVQVYDRDSKSLKALFGRFKNAKSPTGTPSRAPLELIKLKTAEAELGGIDDEFEDGDVEAETVVTAMGGEETTFQQSKSRLWRMQLLTINTLPLLVRSLVRHSYQERQGPRRQVICKISQTLLLTKYLRPSRPWKVRAQKTLLVPVVIMSMEVV